MKKYISILLLAAAVGCGLAASAQNTVRSYCINVGDFNELTVSDDINVRYVANPDSAGFVTYTCTEREASLLMLTPNKLKLKLQVSDEIMPGMEVPTVTVYSTHLDNVSNWGDSTVVIENLAPASQFKAKVVGNGNIKVRNLRVTQFEASIQTGHGTIFATGQAKSAKYSNIGSGSIQASGVKADKVSCKVAGTGSIDCWAENELSVLGMGTGKVYYIGNPTIKKTSLGVKIISMNEDDPSIPQALE